jgi:uncharacterized membrane protein
MTARTIVKALTLLCALVVPTAPAHAQARYQLIDLGVLPGAPGCSATAVDDASDVVGTCESPASAGFEQRGFVWRLGQMTELPKLPTGHYVWPMAITAQGVVLGAADDGSYQPRAYMVRNGVAINMDPSGGQNSYAMAMADNGVVFGRYAKGLSGNTSAWAPVTYTEEASKPGRFRRAALPLIQGGDTKTTGGWIDGGNRRGQAIGTEVSSLFGERALFFENDAAHTPAILEPLAGGYGTIGANINDLGVAIGGTFGPSFYGRATVWNNDPAHTPSELLGIPGDNNSSAVSINNQGQIVGYSYYQVDVMVAPQLHPVLWENGIAIDVTTLLDASADGWTIRYLAAINNAGEIAGTGTFNGQNRAFLLRPLAQ